MFKSSEKLRHEAAQRSLDRVASSWRQARTSWFDGTPESIEARLAATERVLTVARSGFSPAHLELTVEAENARRELMAAKHRLLVDFLDDGARAFKGSRRVALDYDTHPGVPLNQLALPGLNPHGKDPVSIAFDAHGEPVDQAWNADTSRSMAQEGYNMQAVGDEVWHNELGERRIPQQRIQDEADYEKRLREDIGFPPVSYRDHEARVARAPEENENWEEGATYAEYLGGKCTRCKSDNIDASGGTHTGEYDCYDCGATFHPKVRKLKSSVHTAYFDDDLYDEDGEHVGPKWPADLAHHLTGGSPHAGYDAGYDASWHSDFLNHPTPWEAAEAAWDEAGGNRLPGGTGKMDGFGDGWVDAASDIPHQFKDPEGYTSYHAEVNAPRQASAHTAGYYDYENDADGGWDRYVEQRMAPKSVGQETTESGHPVHTFDSTGQAYDECMTNDDIKTGDILHIPSEGVVGLANAWPAAVTKNIGDLHSLKDHIHADPTHLDRSDLGPTSDHFNQAVQYAQQQGYETGPDEGK